MTVIAGEGTPETSWLPWLAATGWAPAVPPVRPGGGRPRALVLAAHPDDEVLGAGGLLHLLGRDGWQVDVVWASDGEASHPGSTVLAPEDLARRRRQESEDARRELGLQGTTTWLALPDSGLQPHEDDVAAAVDHALTGTAADLVVAPWHADGHPDHEVCGRVALAAGRRHGVPVWEVPIWAWHWAEPAEVGARWPHARTVALDETARTAKSTAVQRFVTQVHPLGPADVDRAVLPATVLARFARPFEVVLCSPTPTAGAS
ncbi:PIG-L deacetylase family protein [Aquipuribacter sp. MA13-6]|uniref:PIG-L deacetylase family protein n=1 Tax=unclassified Aquipuribacter TaxID=2635084 RepID=UPI003EEA62B4